MDTAIKRIGLVVVVSLLVATAGCSGLTGGDGAGTADTEETTTGPETETPAGDGTPTPDEGQTQPPGNDNENGTAGADLDGATLAVVSAGAIEGSGSYTVETSRTLTVRQGGQVRKSTLDGTFRIDFEAGQGLREQTQSRNGQERSVTVYTDGNGSYRKQEAGDEVSYDFQQSGSAGDIDPVNVTGFTQNFTGIVDGFAWETAGTAEVDGATVTEYTLTGVADTGTLNLPTDATVDNATGTLLVDGDGVIREAAVSYDVHASDGSTTTLEATISFSDIGSTTVTEPDWLSEAQS